MSAWSDYRCGAISEQEFKYAMQRECGDLFYGDEQEPKTYHCQDCEFCKAGERFVRDVEIREVDKKPVVKTTKRVCYTTYCVKDIEKIREIDDWDEVCDDPGALFDE